MKRILSKGQLSLCIVLAILIIDQVLKVLVKTNMFYGESIHITDWFYIHFIENDGMAFGIKILPKAVQTVSRIIFAGLIIWFITKIIKHECKTGFIICISLILAGALGNIIDSIFYGVIFSESTPFQIASPVAIGNGYSNWMYGKVVDMFHFPFFEFIWPNRIPLIGGNSFTFFGPIFNFADASISCGLIMLLLFYTRDFGKSLTLIKKE